MCNVLSIHIFKGFGIYVWRLTEVVLRIRVKPSVKTLAYYLNVATLNGVHEGSCPSDSPGLLGHDEGCLWHVVEEHLEILHVTSFACVV